ncbi:hypothetical protein JAAARDRAFT_609550 [Jaapia argillacea MUCL 33604]|uniref:Protein kinase domain-containing protein n=1 Tax=Jaapia argillacea MUCL 33604 TaxID=933084 RepID=A0A067P875_9AGAM|nr:hypothetical protein JAAARDRAFT_609550 [Jaapia argillacea MUCL 33604]
MQHPTATETTTSPSNTFVINPNEVEIERNVLLGQGGFGDVYRGNWEGHPVAIKVLLRGIPPKILQKEVEVWQSLRHPNILEFYGCNTSSDPLFIISALKQQGDALTFFTLKPEASRPKLLHEASLGLRYLHRNKIIHGDLKGCNILVDEHGTACLSDFGLSRVREISKSNSARTTRNGPGGTFPWMAPECMIGATLGNTRSDMYSFGMTIYEIFSGRSPFSGLTDPVIYVEVTERKHRPPRPTDEEIVQRGLDDRMWSLAVECWTHEPDSRPRASDLVHRFDSIRKSHTDMGPASPLPGTTTRRGDDVSTIASSLDAVELRPIDGLQNGAFRTFNNVHYPNHAPPLLDSQTATSRQISRPVSPVSLPSYSDVQRDIFGALHASGSTPQSPERIIATPRPSPVFTTPTAYPNFPKLR